jgi:CRP/FNR family transcriptional regulator, cyclic AMP receptor protein
MLRKDARVELLKKIPLFSECSKKDLREIARISDELRVEEGTVLIREGEQGHDLYVVVSGQLEVSRSEGGTIAFIGPGEVAGEMALLSARPRNATVTVATESHLLCAGDRDFLELLDRTPLLWLKVARALADRVQEDEQLERYYRD